MNLKEIENKIKKTKQELLNIEAMRSGSLSEQYNVCGVANCICKDKKNPQRHGPYYQLSYRSGGRSSSKFIQGPFVKKMEKETAQYRRFKILVSEWIDLANAKSDLQMKLEKEKKDKD